MDSQQFAWVLSWQYYDHSNKAVIVRVYLDEKRANEDFALFDSDGGKEWSLTKAPIIGHLYNPSVMRSTNLTKGAE